MTAFAIAEKRSNPSPEQRHDDQRNKVNDDIVEEAATEEHLPVSKSQVERGGAHVRSYVKEWPVSEEVTLREEYVSVERRRFR